MRECNKNEMLNMWTLSLTTGFDTGDKVTQAQNIMPYIPPQTYVAISLSRSKLFYGAS